MRKMYCFYCEKEIPLEYAFSWGGPFAFRHFCTCRDCFDKYKYNRIDSEPPINRFGSWLELQRRILNLCDSQGIDVDSPPEAPLSIRDILDWIGETLWGDFQYQVDTFEPPTVVDGLGRRGVPLMEIIKARESHPEQISIELPPTAKFVLGKFDHRDGILEDISDELP